ncbi:monocarboxylate transporter 3-like [Dermacentor silvarum]|uniref:monocarboxylate transporter 3-like n=1 Tax=Dermacentor silvarum TaxID=543639 RepID=UPI002100AAF8|nr:monocarboxylate transporter 3-like [Dermacentor silvarum]
MNEFGVSHESASWPIAVCTVSVQFSGLLVSYLEKRLSIYHITIAGSLLNFVALIAASFAPNITWMSITFGVLSGAGQGIIVVTLSIYAMLYFDKYRAAASGFKYTGISLAPFFSMLLSLSIQQDGLHVKGNLRGKARDKVIFVNLDRFELYMEGSSLQQASSLVFHRRHMM